MDSEQLPERIDFSKQEEKVLQLWEHLDAFQTSLQLSEGKPEVGDEWDNQEETIAKPDGKLTVDR